MTLIKQSSPEKQVFQAKEQEHKEIIGNENPSSSFWSRFIFTKNFASHGDYAFWFHIQIYIILH